MQGKEGRGKLKYGQFSFQICQNDLRENQTNLRLECTFDIFILSGTLSFVEARWV